MILFLRLLIAHILTDFFLQPAAWIESKNHDKGRSPYLYLHVLITTLVAYIFMGDWSYWYIAILIGLTHLLIDWYKVTFTSGSLFDFLFDQFLHIVVLALVAIQIDGNIDVIAVMQNLLADERILLIITGYLLITFPAGYLVGIATSRWQEELADTQLEKTSLKKAGIWIGILERLLILTFILLNQFQAIGLLIAAKSILRFNNSAGEDVRKQAEYVLIGTLISITLALACGLIIKALIII